MIKDIVVPLAGTQADAAALALATSLAGNHRAVLTVLRVVTLPMPPAAPWGLAAEAGMGELYQRMRNDAEAEAEALRSSLKTGDGALEVRVLESGLGGPGQAALHWLHGADLAVVGNCAGDTSEGDRTRDLVASLLLGSGRPVLVAPARTTTGSWPPRHAVVAWKPGAGAARALHDALPLLRQATSVDLVMIDAPEGDGAPDPAMHVLQHLQRHGVAASQVMLRAGQERHSAVLLGHARTSGAGLLVAGGYGHSRLRQWALGGMTRELLFEADLPVLFSH